MTKFDCDKSILGVPISPQYPRCCLRLQGKEKPTHPQGGGERCVSGSSCPSLCPLGCAMELCPSRVGHPSGCPRRAAVVEWHEVEHVCKTPPCWPHSCASTTSIRVGPANALCAHSSLTSTAMGTVLLGCAEQTQPTPVEVAQGGMEPEQPPHVHAPVCQQPPALCPAPHRGLPGF